MHQKFINFSKIECREIWTGEREASEGNRRDHLETCTLRDRDFREGVLLCSDQGQTRVFSGVTPSARIEGAVFIPAALIPPPSGRSGLSTAQSWCWLPLT